MFTCEFCNKEYSSLSSLNYHKKTAKFCLNLQSEKNQVCKQNTFECEFCEKIFIVKSTLLSHLQVCKKKKEKEIEEEKTKIIKQKNEFENSSDKKIKELNILLKSEKEKNTKLKEENISLKIELKTEIKNKDKQIEDYKLIIDKLHKEHKHEIAMMTERLTARTITTNNTIVNTYNGIDFSQSRFDKHIEDNYTFELYEKHQEGVKIIFLDFLYFNENIHCVVTDDSRDKIKVTDNTYRNHKFITFNQLYSLCQESKKLVEILDKHATEFFKKPDTNPLFPLHEEVKDRSLNFKEKGLKFIFNKIKGIINSNNENRVPSLSIEQKNNNELIEEKTNEISENTENNDIYYNISITPPKDKFNRPLDLFSEEADEKAREYREKFGSN